MKIAVLGAAMKLSAANEPASDALCRESVHRILRNGKGGEG